MNPDSILTADEEDQLKRLTTSVRGKKMFIVIKCLHCHRYIVWDGDSQVDCSFCGYSNELNDRRVEYWGVREYKK
jgi:hypothetical protein